MDTNTLIKLIEEASGASDVSLETRIEDLGIDSLEFLDIVCMVEEASGIKVPNKKLKEIRTVRDLCSYVPVPN